MDNLFHQISGLIINDRQLTHLHLTKNNIEITRGNQEFRITPDLRVITPRETYIANSDKEVIDILFYLFHKNG